MAFGELSMLQIPIDETELRRSDWLDVLREAMASLEAWEDQWPEYREELACDSRRASLAIEELAARLRDNLPYFHPMYAGHMLKPPHPVAWAAYALTALVNPNNQTREVGAATTDMELEVVDALIGMLGFGESAAGHLTSSGTIANLEAMWIARETHPGKAIACSKAAHYNYSRIADLIQVPLIAIPTRADETINTDALAKILAREDVGTVVATLGTTGLGVVDPLDDIVEIARRHGARVHVDAAYGGFFALLAGGDDPLVDPEPFEAIARADSLTIDPHKHGLQPYGCGCIVYRDRQALAHYQHDSPYTYLDRSALHLGQIQFECSRAGASAAALWATLRALPLQPNRGFGAILGASRRTAVAWAQAIDESEQLRLVVPPHLDIVSFAVWPRGRESVRASEVTRWSNELLERGASAEELPFYLTRYDISTEIACRLWPDLEADAQRVSVLRSCMMKPEQEEWWPILHRRVLEVAGEVAALF